MRWGLRPEGKPIREDKGLLLGPGRTLRPLPSPSLLQVSEAAEALRAGA